MSLIRKISIVLLSLGVTTALKGQVADFTAPASACLNQIVSLQNNSTGATTYRWDFCQDAISHAPINTDVVTVSAANIPVGLQTAYDNGSWYAFVNSRDGGSQLTRLDFGASLTNAPSVADISSSVSSFGGSSDISLIRAGGNWYGFVVDYQTNGITRLNFGSSPGNAPTSTPFGNLGGGAWNGLYGVTITQQGSNYFGLVTCTFTGTVSLLQFGSSITNTPVVSHFTNSLFVNPVKVKFVRQGSRQFALVSCVNLANQSNGSVVLLDFGTDLASAPTISQIAVVPAAAGMDVVNDGGNFYALVFGGSGTLTRLDFGTSVVNAPVATDLGHVGSTNVVYGLSMIKDWPNWKGLYIEVLSEKVHLLSFTDQCSGVSPLTSALLSPDVTYQVSGSKRIELAAYSATGAIDTLSHPITVQALAAPAVDITAQNECVGSPVLFGEDLTAGPAITGSLWDFGDGNTDNQPTPSHTYASTGTYPVVLTVSAANGCMNKATRSVPIYHVPTAAFQLPSNNPLCTNQIFTFTNTSTSDVGSTLSWQWFVNGAPVATTQDLQYGFATTSAQAIKLRAIIPGCFNENTQSITSLLTGPNVDFAALNGCQLSTITFTNLTTDPVTGFQWNFGDGNTSTATDGVHAFSSATTYQVSLTGGSSNGCQNTATKAVVIHSKPQTDFAIDLPPFSCSGTPSQFHDATPNPTDSNITGWSWTFGDPANGTSGQRNPLYTYSLAGPYTVGLTATTNFSCSATVQKVVTIAQSPAASFTHGPACVSQGTQFTDTSTGNIKAWSWSISNSTYTFSNPIQVFTTNGSYPASLVVTDQNNCIAQAVQNVIVPVGQSPDFSFSANCAGKSAQFLDTTPVSSDAIVSQAWDFGTAGTGTGSPAFATFPSTGVYPVTLQVKAQSGCQYVTTRNVSVVAAPVAAFTPTPAAGAAPLNVKFVNSSANATNYLWHFGDPANSSSNTAEPSFSYSELGDYVVDLQASNSVGCSDVVSHVVSALVPRADGAISGLQLSKDPVSGTWKAIYVLTNVGNLVITTPTVNVEISGNVLLQQQVPVTITPGGSSVQTLSYSIASGDVRYVCLRLDVPGDANLSNNDQCVTADAGTVYLQPYPNPATAELNFDWIADAAGTVTISIYSATGAKAFEQTWSTSATGLQRASIDVSAFSPGIYLADFVFNGRRASYRVAVHR